MMEVRTYRKGSEEKVSISFSAKEFDCPCKCCMETLIDPKLVMRLQRLREDLDCPITINSGYRCVNHHHELELQGYETAKNSSHLQGRAVDIQTGKHSGAALEIHARNAGFRAVGVGRTWIHADTRDEKDRSWSYYKR